MHCTRRQFIALMPAAVGAGALVGGLALPGCGQAIDGSVTIANGRAVLTFAQFPKLNAMGGGVIVDTSTGGALAVIRSTATTATALDAICTHAGCTVAYSGSDLSCPCHGSRFALNGAVTNGPASSPLAIYSATVSTTGITVTVG
jgi:cytochrome b6-f complex iron-sulfur subunit